jgi:hypothetical protein
LVYFINNNLAALFQWFVILCNSSAQFPRSCEPLDSCTIANVNNWAAKS